MTAPLIRIKTYWGHRSGNRRLWQASFLALEQLQFLEQQIGQLDQEMASLLRPHQDAVERLAEVAKAGATCVALIGHVTKEGAVAGPRVLEHIVDAVLYLEGERFHAFRILRATKNRFGSTNEIGVFEMKEAGLKEVTNPSEIFLMERPLEVPGSAVVCSMEGTRPILVELQSLVSRSFLAVPRHNHRCGP